MHTVTLTFQMLPLQIRKHAVLHGYNPRMSQFLSDLDDLHQHALRVATTSFDWGMLARPDARKSKTFLRAQVAATAGLGLHVASSTAFWKSPEQTDRQRTLALQVHFATLLTRSRLAKWYPNANLDSSCPFCLIGQNFAPWVRQQH